MKIEGIEDALPSIKEWEWGDPPHDAIAFHQASCVIGAETLLREMADDCAFLVNCTEDELTINFLFGDHVAFKDSLSDCIIRHTDGCSEEDVRHMASLLRATADKIESRISSPTA